MPVEQARTAHLAETEELAGEGSTVAHVRGRRASAASPCASTRPTEAHGTVAYLHGGGWVMGNLESVDAVCRALANGARARVVSIDYRLAPEHPFPAALDDALTVVRALDGELVIAGDSAGANLAAVVARKLRDRFKLQLLVYPVTDAGVNTPSYGEFDERYGLTAAAMHRFWGLYLNGARRPAPRRLAAARRGPRRPSPPAYVITASHDVLRDEGEAYAAALERAGVRGRAAPRRGHDPRLLALADDRDRARHGPEAGAAVRPR